MPPKRPNSITTVAVFAIVMGGLGVLCCGLGQLVGAAGIFGEMQMPDGTVIKPDPGVASIGAVMAIVTVLAAGTLLVVGIGALRLANWARQLGIIVAVVVLLLAITRFVITVTYTGPKTEQLMKQMEDAMARNQKAGQPAPPQIAKFVSGGTIGVGIVALLLEALTPALILMLWTKQPVKQAFEAGPFGYSGQPQYGYGPGAMPGQPPYGQGYPPGGNPPPPVS